MNQKNELKIIELKLKMFSKQFSKTELIIRQIETIFSFILLYKYGIFISLTIGLLISYLITKFINPKIKQIQTELEL
jgi:hypothetical protein